MATPLWDNRCLSRYRIPQKPLASAMGSTDRKTVYHVDLNEKTKKEYADKILLSLKKLGEKLTELEEKKETMDKT